MRLSEEEQEILRSDRGDFVIWRSCLRNWSVVLSEAARYLHIPAFAKPCLQTSRCLLCLGVYLNYDNRPDFLKNAAIAASQIRINDSEIPDELHDRVSVMEVTFELPILASLPLGDGDKIRLLRGLYNYGFSPDIAIDGVATTQTPLFSPSAPESAESMLNLLSKTVERHREWEFWLAWYEAFLVGKPVNWELQAAIADTPQDIWNNGPQAVAKHIQEVRKEHSPDATDLIEAQHVSFSLRQHVLSLLRKEKEASVNAVGLAFKINEAVAAFRRDNPINETPDDLLLVEAIADTLGRIGKTLAQSGIDSTEQASRAKVLELEVHELTERIGELEAELENSKAKEVKGLITTGLLLSLPTATLFTLGSSLVSAANYYVAPEQADGLTRHIGDYLFDLMEKDKIELPQIGKE